MGIVINVKTADGERQWGGQAMDVAHFFNLQGITENPFGTGDNRKGTITIEDRKIIIDTNYYAVSLADPAVKFWESLGFEVLVRRGDR